MGARYDQHFLIDEQAIRSIIRAADVKKGDKVVEIGPGRGALTGPLLAAGAELTALEIDDRKASGVEGRFRGAPGLRVVCADFLKFNLDSLGRGPFKIVANLPYSVASPILQKVLPWPEWSSAVLMFQKEVAERLAAEPATRDYGLLTLTTRFFAEAETLLDLPPKSFSPPPRVHSSVVRLIPRRRPLADAQTWDKALRLAKAAFSQRRKMAAGLLAAAAGRPRGEVEAILLDLGLDGKGRAETIPLEGFLALASRL